MGTALALVVPVLFVVASAPARAAGGCADDGPCVIVRVVDGTTETSRTVFGVTELEAMIDQPRPTSYATRSQPDGPTGETVAPPAVSLHALVAATTDVAGVHFADVADEDDMRHPLGGSEFGAPDPGGLVPVFWLVENPETVSYIRPLRGPDDVNNARGPDRGLFSTRGALVVTAHTTGELLDVQANATGDQATRTYSFTTDVDPAFDHTWTFGDGSSPDTNPKPTHTYAADGTYGVVVAVESTDGSFGYGTTQAVGKAPKATPSPGPTGTGTNPDPSAPANGPNTGSGTTVGGAPTGRSTSRATQAPSARPTATATATATSVGSATASGPSPGTGPADPVGPLAPPPDVGAPLEATTTPTPAGEQPPAVGQQVAGILLTSAESGAAPDAAAVSDPPSAPSARALSTDDSPLSPALWWSLVVPLLLLAGAAREARWRPRTAPWRRRTVPGRTMER